MRGFTNACLYLDASRSNLNKPTVIDQAGTSVTINSGTGMNEFYAEDFIFRSNTNGKSDFGIKIQGSTRNPDSYNEPTDSTNPWIWGWGGASDIVFNSGRTSGISLDGAIKNAAKTIQGQRFIAVDSRVNGESGVLLNIDRAHRVDFISGYGEPNPSSGTAKMNFTGNTGKCNFVFSDYNSNIFLTPTAWSSSVAYTIGQRVLANSKIYEAQTEITGGSEPSHSTGIIDNWKYIVASGTTLGAFGTTYVNENISVFTERGEFVTANGLLNDNDVLRPVVDGGINLGTSSFNYANVRTKKVQSDKFIFNKGDNLSINVSGAVTVTHSYHLIDTDNDATSDDLDTINGGTAGQMLLIRAQNDGRTVVVKNGTGNLTLSANFTLDHSTDSLLLMYVGPNWIEISRSSNGT